MGSAITINTAQLKANNVFNADNTPIYNTSSGDWTLKNASGVSVFTVAGAGTVTLGPASGGVTHKVNGANASVSGGFNLLSTAALGTGIANSFIVFDGATQKIEFGAYNNPSGAGSGSGFIGLVSSGSATTYFLYHSAGVWYTSSAATDIGRAAGTVIGTQTSDRAQKTNIRPNSYGLSIILATETFEFEMNRQLGVNRVGFIAQESQKTLPESVYDAGEAGLAMYYTEYIPVLVKAIQELAAQNAQLQSRIEALEAG